MGCAISNFQSRIVDLSKRSHNLNSDATIISPQNLHRFLSEDNPNPKCIFIFGGSGSNKGQFIWEIMEQSCENFLNNPNNEIIKLIVDNEDEIDFTRFRYSYYYVDVEKLIVENLDTRIKSLQDNPMQHHQNNNFLAEQTSTTMINNIDNVKEDFLDVPEHLVKRRRRSNPSDEALKNQLSMYANVITNSWILSLLKQEIENNVDYPHERIFLINLIPNRLTMFKECLFLKQTPSFMNFDYNYVAIKLLRHVSRRKELEIKTVGQYDEINNNFFNYFKNIGKLYEIRVKSVEDKIRFKLSTSNKAIKLANKIDLISFIQMPKKDSLELNIAEFGLDEFEPILNRCRTTSLFFVINNEIDLDDNLRLTMLNDKQYDHLFLRKFIQIYRLTSYSLKFV